jgi:hypothetical protein
LIRTLLTLPVLASVSASQAADIGINFQDDWGSGGGTAVTQDAFGVPAANWYNMPRVPNSSGGGGVSSNATITLAGGGTLRVEWSCQNTYSLTGDPTVDGPGEDQVVYGYLDDTAGGYRVRLSGFRDSMASYKVSLIASTDSGEGFTDALVVRGGITNTLAYGDIQSPSLPGVFATSPATDAIATQTDNNVVVITGVPRAGALRSTLAGILINYTPGGSNPPLMETQPQAPVGTIYAGQGFSLTSLASGSATLNYQWRRDGTTIPQAMEPVFRRPAATTADGGLYDVVVSNGFGSITSTVARVTISEIVLPTIVKAPIPQTLYVGYPATLAVEASGGQLAYQWKKGTTALAGQTNATLVLPSVRVSDADTYSVEVSNAAGSAAASATLAVKVAAPGSYEAEMAMLKPLLYFRMGETGPVAQSTAANSGSLGAAGTGLYVGAVTHGVQGALAGSSDTAMTLSGGRVAVPYSDGLNPAGSFTVECWANPLDLVAGNRVLAQAMINGENADNANDRTGWVLRHNGANLEFMIGGEVGAPFYTTIATAQAVVVANTWAHYAAVYRSDTLNVSLLVNGIEVTNVVAAEPLLRNFAAPLLLGDRGYGGWNFKGSLDEVAIYPTALTTSKLLAHYQAGSSAATSASYPSLVTGDGAVAYLRLNDAGLTPTSNAAANGGTLGSGWAGSYVDAGSTLGRSLIAKGAEGPRPATYPGLEAGNTAVAMTNGWVTAPALTLGNQVTVTCWLKREATSTTGDLSWPAWLGGGGMHLNQGTAANQEAELRYHWNGGAWGWGSGLFVPADVWTFAVMVVEPEQAVFYMSNGTELLSSTNVASHTPMIITSAPGFGGNQPGRADRNYIGQLDETAVFDRALSPSEVSALFARALGTGPLPPSAITISRANNEVTLTWTSGVLQESATVGGTYTDVANSPVSPLKVPTAGGQRFYRLRGQ